MLILVFFSCFLSLYSFASEALCQANIPDPCALFTKQEADAIFKESMSGGQSGIGAMPSSKTCKYSFKKKGATYGVTIKLSTTQALKEEGFYSSAKDVFTRYKKARMSSGELANKMIMVQGLGDEAFWNGYDLWVVVGDYFLNIAASSFLDGSFKNTEEMEKQRYEQDLGLSRHVAEKAIEKLK